VVAGKAITLRRKAGKVYRVGRMLSNGGMFPLKCAHLIAQSPFLLLDMVVLGEPYVPHLNPKWWNIGNATDDAETIAEWAANRGDLL